MIFSGKKLAYYRRMNGFSQKGLAEKVGIYQQDINRLEHSKRQPTTDLFFRICIALKIENPFLLGEIE